MGSKEQQEYRMHLKEVLGQWFKSEAFYYPWDFSLKNNKNVFDARRCEDAYLYLQKEFNLTIVDVQKLVYGYLQRKTHLYFAFVIKDNQIFHISWCKKRNQIGPLLGRFCSHDVIIWFPETERFQYYIKNQYPYGKHDYCPFHGHKRVSEEQFKVQRGEKSGA